MYNDLEKDTFGFEPDNEKKSFNYDSISGLGESDYVNEDLFNTEVSNESFDEKQINNNDLGYEVEIPIEYQYSNNDEEKIIDSNNLQNNEETVLDNTFSETLEEKETPNFSNTEKIDTEFLQSENDFNSGLMEVNYELPIVKPTIETSVVPTAIPKVNALSETPIEELNKLTEFNEEKIQTTDIKSLFDRVGVNVKEASDIFKKNTEMKEKIDSRFEELKKLQAEVEKSKKSQYDEINSYKEEVINKLTEKKEEIENRINKLREFQSSLEKEREEFEQYRKREKEEIERVQKEVQEAYDSRREELNHIEDVLRKQKDALDEERSQLSLDIIQYESDKNELANNLLKFNEIVDSFTNGMDKINKE